MADCVDLHLHSTASDGDHAPADVARMAHERGLRAAALTDHDTIDGVPAFLAAAKTWGMEGVAGVEVGVANDERRGLKEVHMLGYFVEPGDHPLGRALERLQRAKVDWSVRQVAVLVEQGFDLPYDEVAAAAEGSPTVRRPHIWRVLSRHNPGALTAEDYFRRTDFGGPWFTPKDYEIPLEEAVQLVLSSGGVPVLAHPAFYGIWPDGALAVLDLACDAGVVGVEVYYAYDAVGAERGLPSQRAIAAVLADEADRRGLVATGGSDFHGSATKGIEIGDAEVPYRCLERLRERRP